MQLIRTKALNNSSLNSGMQYIILEDLQQSFTGDEEQSEYLTSDISSFKMPNMFGGIMALTAFSSYETLNAENNQTYNESSITIERCNELRILSSYYVLENSTEISKFISENLEILSPLIELKREIFKNFNTLYAIMELIQDVEIPDWKTLSIKIPYDGQNHLGNLKLLKMIKSWLVLQPKKFKTSINLSLASNEF